MSTHHPVSTHTHVNPGYSPLHEVPILVKDNIATDDNLAVSGGSFALLGAKPTAEFSVIRKLRDAGAIILGRPNLSEWANFRGLDVSSGWSPRGGQALGIFKPNTSPGGSSSGSAIAAALGLSTAALGTEVSHTGSPIQAIDRPTADTLTRLSAAYSNQPSSTASSA